MNTLRSYKEDQTTALFKSNGAFFAFTDAQFDESKVKGIEYTSMGAGLICPVKNAATLAEGLNTISAAAIAQDVTENGVKAIIHRELANHEAQICGDIESTVYALAGYPISREDIQAQWSEFFHHCVENDYF